LHNRLEAAGKVDTRPTLLTGFVQRFKALSGPSAVCIRLLELDKIWSAEG
jgi:hypothetical protein